MDNQYLTVRCPKCYAEPGEPCTGLTLAESYGYGCHPSRATVYFIDGGDE